MLDFWNLSQNKRENTVYIKSFFSAMDIEHQLVSYFKCLAKSVTLMSHRDTDQITIVIFFVCFIFFSLGGGSPSTLKYYSITQ